LNRLDEKHEGLSRRVRLAASMDDRSQPRINIEAEAVLMILRFVASSDLELLASEVLQF